MEVKVGIRKENGEYDMAKMAINNRTWGYRNALVYCWTRVLEG